MVKYFCFLLYPVVFILFFVISVADAQEGLPDLIVDTASYTLTPDGHANLTFTVRNIGEARSAASNYRWYWVQADGRAMSEESGVQPLAPIDSGDSRTLTFTEAGYPTYLVNPPAGGVRIKALVDWGNALQESNDTNNEVLIEPITSETTGEELATTDEEQVVQEIEQELHEATELVEVSDDGDPDRQQIQPGSVSNPEASDPETGDNQTQSIRRTGGFEPAILPGNPLYLFKTLNREVQAMFTLDPAKDAEIRLRFANEKILEANILTDQGKTERAADHIKSYNRELKKLNQSVLDLEKENKDAAQNIYEKSAKSELKHQILIGKIERDVSVEKLIGLKEVRSKVLDNIAQTIDRLDDKKTEKVLTDALTSSGSPFRQLRNLEVLEAVEAKVPEQAQNAIEKAQENAVKKFADQFESLPEKHKNLFPEYIKNAGGDEVLYVKTLDLVSRENVSKATEKALIGALEATFARIDTRTKEILTKDPDKASIFFTQLSGQKGSNFRALKDIERNTDQSLSFVVEEAKSKAFIEFLNRIASLDTVDKRIDFVCEISIPDPKQLAILEEFSSQFQFYKSLPNTSDGKKIAKQRLTEAKEATSFIKKALDERHSLLSRMRDLAEQASSETVSDAERTYLNQELNTLNSQLRSSEKSVQYQGRTFLDGSLRGNSALQIRVGNEAQNPVLTIEVSDLRAEALGINNISISTIAPASSALSAIDAAINQVLSQRAEMGATSNRLDSARESLDTTRENLSAAQSRVKDVDFANELANLVRNQILSQAGGSVSAQANSQSQTILRLLGGAIINTLPGGKVEVKRERTDVSLLEELCGSRGGSTISGDSEDVKTIEANRDALGDNIADTLIKKSTDDISVRIDHIKDPDRLKFLENKFREETKARPIVEKASLEILDKFKQAKPKLSKTKSAVPEKSEIGEASAECSEELESLQKEVDKVYEELFGKQSMNAPSRLLAALRINQNIDALNAQRNLGATNERLAKSMERLSSGLRINRVSDDAEGLAVSEKLNRQNDRLNNAVSNTNDGISFAQTADASLQEGTNILYRMRELAVQSANDTNTVSDRAALQAETDSVVTDMDRIVSSTTFNGTQILDRNFNSKLFRAGASRNDPTSISIEAVDRALDEVKQKRGQLLKDAKESNNSCKKEVNEMRFVLKEVKESYKKKPTKTVLPTATPTIKETLIPTPIPTKTVSPTPTPIFTKEPILSPTPVKTISPTPTPAPTKTTSPTPTPTKEVTPTPTPTQSPTPTPTPSPTKEATPTPTPTKEATPTPTPTISKPVISSFVASPTAIALKQSSTLSWDVSGADSVILSNTKETLTSSGKKVVYPTATTTYTITASNKGGSTSASVTVTVK